MKYTKILLFALVAFFVMFPLTASANDDLEGLEEGDNYVNRDAIDYPTERYTLMDYSDASWYEVGERSADAGGSMLKHSAWAFYLALSQVVLMFVYQLFSLDIVDITKDAVTGITSAVAGGLVTGFGQFALAIFGIGLVIRSYVQQNWAAFMKLTTMVIISMALLFSISSERFDYVSLASGLSTTLENAVMNVNPSLTGDDDISVRNLDDTAVALENKVFHALIYQPYLLLQYGTTDEEEILSEDPERITAWLEQDPRTEEGFEAREDIAEDEYKEYNNYQAASSAGYDQTAYVLTMMLSTIVQGAVYFFIAMLRIMLQFGFIMLLLLAPFAIFLSLFPSFEAVIGKYLRLVGLVIMFKAITMFMILVSVSFISLGYDMTNTSDDLYYRIFIQIVFAIAIIFMYAKRGAVMNMIEGSGLSVEDMGGGRVPGMSRMGQAAKRGAGKVGGVTGGLAKKGVSKVGGKVGSGLKSSGARIKSGISGMSQKTKHAASSGFTAAGAGATAGVSKARAKGSQAVDRFKQQQMGGDPNAENIYAGNSGEREATKQETAKQEAAATREAEQKPSKFRSAKAFISQQQQGGPIGNETYNENPTNHSTGSGSGTGSVIKSKGSVAQTKGNVSSGRGALTNGSTGTKRNASTSTNSSKKQPKRAKMANSNLSSARSKGSKSQGRKSVKQSTKKLDAVRQNAGNKSQQSINRKANSYRQVPPKQGKNLTKGEAQRQVKTQKDPRQQDYRKINESNVRQARTNQSQSVRNADRRPSNHQATNQPKPSRTVSETPRETREPREPRETKQPRDRSERRLGTTSRIGRDRDE